MDTKYTTYSGEAFNAYQNYCNEFGMKPYGHNKFVENIKSAFPELKSGRDSISGNRTLEGIKVIEL